MQPPETPHVLAVCGSMRDGSRTRVVLETVLAAATEAGATTGLLDLRTCDLPSLYAAEGSVSDASTLRRQLRAADSLVLGTPNYHGSYSGALKDALDHCGTDEFEGATVGLVEVAAGEFPGSAVAHLRAVCRTLHAWTLPTEVAVPESHDRIADGEIADPDIAERARRLGTVLVEYAGVSAFPDVVREQQPCTTAPEESR